MSATSKYTPVGKEIEDGAGWTRTGLGKEVKIVRYRWTIEELRGTDDLTFAMCILSERREALNQEAPLAKRLASAYHALEELRDIYRANPDVAAGTVSPAEAIYRKVQHDYLLDDIKSHMGAEAYNAIDCLEGHGLTPEKVMGDRGMMAWIIELFHQYDGKGDYWEMMDLAIIQGIEDTLTSRKAG